MVPPLGIFHRHPELVWMRRKSRKSNCSASFLTFGMAEAISGSMFVDIAAEYCKAINSSVVPTIHTAWTSAIQHQLRLSLRDAVQAYRSKMNDHAMQNLPMSDDKLRNFCWTFVLVFAIQSIAVGQRLVVYYRHLLTIGYHRLFFLTSPNQPQQMQPLIHWLNVAKVTYTKSPKQKLLKFSWLPSWTQIPGAKPKTGPIFFGFKESYKIWWKPMETHSTVYCWQVGHVCECNWKLNFWYCEISLLGCCGGPTY